MDLESRADEKEKEESSALGGLLGSMGKLVGGVGQLGADVIKDFAVPVTKSVVDTSAKIVKSSANAVKDVSNAISKAGEDTKKGIQDATSEASKTMVQQTSNLKASVENKVGDAINTICKDGDKGQNANGEKGAVDRLIDNTVNGINWFGEKTGKGLDWLGEKTSDGVKEITSYADTVLNHETWGLATNIDKGVNLLNDYGKTGIEKMKTKVSDFADWLTGDKGKEIAKDSLDKATN